MSKTSARSVIRLRGVRHNNLKNFDLDLPLNQLIVVTGLSGSGKSSLAFDTLFAEGQRRYIETFSPYARQFFDRMDKPQVDSIEGIPPAIAIEQRNSVKSTRSTVGTMTEICDHMKVLWPHIAQLHCKRCGQLVRKDSPQDIWERVVAADVRRRTTDRKSSQDLPPPYVSGYDGKDLLVTFDVPLSGKISLEESLALISKQGYQRVLLDGEIIRLEDVPSRFTLHVSRPTSLTIVQDRVKPIAASRARFVEASEQAYHFGKGKLTILALENRQSTIGNRQLFSTRLHCAACDLEYREPSPALFSFNHPVGACPACKGFGRAITIDYDLAIPDRSLTLAEGAVKPWRGGVSADSQTDMVKFCKKRRVPVDVPFAKLSVEHQRWVVEGDADYGSDAAHQWPKMWYGVKGYFKWLESKSYKMHVRVLLSRYRAYTICPECQGARFQPEALLYKLPIADCRLPIEKSEITLADFYSLSVRDTQRVIKSLAQNRQSAIGNRQSNDPIATVFGEVRARLSYLNEVGLGYLTLDRSTRSLSGGETERVNLTTCLGTRLVNTLFVLDEPSVGLHPRDTERLVRILEKLRDNGNTVVVVEHEASVMRAANQILDIGPGHGATGGQIVFQGAYADILKSEDSLTGKYLGGREQIEIPLRRPVGLEFRLQAASVPNRLKAELQTDWLRIQNATRHNLKNLSVAVPLRRLVCLTGVSGSGKTTLVREVLLPALEANFQAEIANLKSGATKASDRIEDETEKEEYSGKSAIGNRQSAILEGHENIGRVVLVDQSALGKTPRSNPAVYIGAFEDIREVFAQSEAAKQRGLNASSFSFNSAQGQCERCRGAGFEKIEMQFLSDVFIRCSDCNGRRYRAHILEVKVSSSRREEALTENSESEHATPERSVRERRKTKTIQSLLTSAATNRSWSIADVLDTTVDEVIDFFGGFADSKPARRAVESLKLLQEVGLGYLKLGQPINTLSGGESQRLKLVSHLAESSAGVSPVQRPIGDEAKDSFASPSGGTLGRRDARPTLFLFDEPTTGLHFDDVRALLKVFQRLVDAGHSVIVIEHNLDVIKSADWVIDLGPEAGDLGGQIVAQGTPEDIAECEQSNTGRHLKSVLQPKPNQVKP